MYPEIPRILAAFIRVKIRGRLLRGLVSAKGAKQLIEMLGEAPSRLNPFYFVEVEKDWGNRHMFRAPYSLNEKTWLVSIPVPHINSFSPKDAEYENVLAGQHPDFFGAEGDMTDLLTDAMDWHAARKKEPEKKEVKKIIWEHKVPEELFPPCMKLILAGLEDGKKRSIFTLVNFLKMMNWSAEEIEQKINEWNSRNKPPLPSSIILSGVRYHEQRALTPANCFNDQFYVSFGVCRPDETCKAMNAKKTSNPVAYPFKKMRRSKEFYKRQKLRGFSCGICNKEFKTPRSLELHKGRVH